jgi:3-hydroxyacyl-[acyl-carrier-protein] dehydratase
LALLLNKLYHLTKVTAGEQDGDFLVEVSINPEHSIFEGHFPEVPVMPGVCLMQLVADAASEVTGKKLRILEGTDMKFTAVVDPRESTTLLLQLNVLPAADSTFKVNCINTFNGQISFKFKGILGE